jgi:hypothetical protein
MNVPLRPAVVLQIAVGLLRQAAGERMGEGEPVLDRRFAQTTRNALCV